MSGAARPEEMRLAELNALDPAADRTLQVERVRKALEDRHVRVVARAAQIAGERAMREQVPHLLRAFSRFRVDDVKRDPKCTAKQAIARALVELDCDDVDFFIAGIGCRQMEPVWGGSTDTAVDVRCACAMGLVASGYSRAIVELTALLNDQEWRARVGAARAIACGNPREAETLLRFKALAGDTEDEVIGECLAGLMSVAPGDSLTFVASFLEGDADGLRDQAALALGDSRHEAAFAYLRAAWDGILVSEGLRIVLIRAAALHRSEPAFNWLISLIETGADAHSDAAAEALLVYDRNTRLVERVHAALESRNSRSRGGS